MNTFGTSTSKYPLYDPRGAREARVRFRRSRLDLLDRANSIYIPSGRYPTRGWILLSRRDYDKLDTHTYSTALQLEIGDPRDTNNVATLKNLAIVQAHCVTRGLAEDLDALYLVELTDGRGVLHNEWFQFPLTEWYNIRAPAYPQTFHPGSMNSGTTWTWATMLEDIWERMSGFLGAWPGLPAGVTIAGTPEGYWFPGVPAWTALCDILDHLGLTVACDLTSDTPFTIVRPGATDAAHAAHAALLAKYAATTSNLYRLEDDLEWIDTGAGRVPKTVKVLFRKRYDFYGTEETVRRDAPQWAMEPLYEVSVAAPAAFASAVGTHYLWSDFTVRYDMDGNALAADTAIATAIAQERVTQYFATIYRQTLGRADQTYTGALPFKTGSQVDGVCYYQDYRDDRWSGWRTRVVRGAQPPFADVW